MRRERTAARREGAPRRHDARRDVVMRASSADRRDAVGVSDLRSAAQSTGIRTRHERDGVAGYRVAERIGDHDRRQRRGQRAGGAGDAGRAVGRDVRCRPWFDHDL